MKQSILLILSFAGLAFGAPEGVGAHGMKAEVTAIRGNLNVPTTQRNLQEEDEDDEGGIDIGSILGIACFSDIATVQVQEKGIVAMKDLNVGDKVLTRRNDYQPVYSFGHYNPTQRAEFRQVHTEEAVLELTPEHLVFLKGQSYPVRADSLNVGDALQGQDGMDQTITKITSVIKEGVYAPFTPEGTVVVDGIVASSYISLQEGNDFVELKTGNSFLKISQHDYVHMGLSPMRLLCMGIAPSYCTLLNHDGVPFYAAMSIDLNLWANGQSAPVQAMVFAGIFMLAGSSYLVESIFGPSVAPLAIFAAAIIFCLRRKIAPMKKVKAV